MAVVGAAIVGVAGAAAPGRATVGGAGAVVAAGAGVVEFVDAERLGAREEDWLEGWACAAVAIASAIAISATASARQTIAHRADTGIRTMAGRSIMDGRIRKPWARSKENRFASRSTKDAKNPEQRSHRLIGRRKTGRKERREHKVWRPWETNGGEFA